MPPTRRWTACNRPARELGSFHQERLHSRHASVPGLRRCDSQHRPHRGTAICAGHPRAPSVVGPAPSVTTTLRSRADVRHPWLPGVLLGNCGRTLTSAFGNTRINSANGQAWQQEGLRPIRVPRGKRREFPWVPVPDSTGRAAREMHRWLVRVGRPELPAEAGDSGSS
jgi:hypothetical protein